MKTLIAVVVFIFSTNAAQATKIVNNGGDSVRLDIVASQQYLAGACDQIETLRVLNVSCFDLRRLIQTVGQNNERLHIEDDVDLGDGILRSGKNNPTTIEITFSRKFWLAAEADQIRKIGIVLHEYLGLMGVELTDDYRVSNLVVNELRKNPEIAPATTGAGRGFLRDQCVQVAVGSSYLEYGFMNNGYENIAAGASADLICLKAVGEAGNEIQKFELILKKKISETARLETLLEWLSPSRIRFTILFGEGEPKQILGTVGAAGELTSVDFASRILPATNGRVFQCKESNSAGSTFRSVKISQIDNSAVWRVDLYENGISYVSPRPLMNEYVYLDGNRDGGDWHFSKSDSNWTTALALHFKENGKVNAGMLTLRHSENYELICQEK